MPWNGRLVTCSGEILGKENLGLDFGRTVVAGANDGLRLRPGMTVAEAERRLIHRDPDVHRKQQDARRGTLGNQFENPAQQVERV